jgi:type II secretory pathway component GspD/PulD (secretin)
MGYAVVVCVAASGLACGGRPMMNPVDIRRLPSETPMYSGSQGSQPPPPLPPPPSSRSEVSIANGAVTCDLVNAPLEDVLHQIDEATPLQFVYRGLLRGRVSAKLDAAPLESALTLLFEAGNYSYQRNGDVFVISRGSEDEREEGDSAVQEVYLENADARQVLKQLRDTFQDQERRAGFGLLPGAAGLYVVGTPAQIDDVMDVISIVDRPVQQVLIETMVIEVEEEDFVELGLGLTRLTGGRLTDFSTAPGSSVFPALSLTLDAAGEASRSFFTSITALSERGSANIVSRPYVVARSGEPAEMRSEQVVNVTAERTVSGNSVSTFEEIRAGTTMTMNPTVNPDDSITLYLELEHSQFLSLSTVGDVDIRRTFEAAKATINVRDGETVVFGGFIQRRDISGTTSVPFLDRIPWIKHLFTRKSTQVEESETVFVLTPHLLPVDFDKFRSQRPPRLGEPEN